MFGFAKKNTPAPTPQPHATELDKKIQQTIFAADPLTRAKFGGKEIFNRFIQAESKNGTGKVRIEDLLAQLGAVAGYSCQAALRKELIEKMGKPENEVFIVIETKDGGRYFAGDPLNKLLLGYEYSVASIATGNIKQLGLQNVPSLEELMKYADAAIGSDKFGVPDVSPEHVPTSTLEECLKAFWPVMESLMDRYTQHPMEWPMIFAIAVQHALQAGKGVIAPEIAYRLVMDRAIAASKINIGII